ncbi:hypothetical protein [Comamonas sp. C24C]
MKNHQIEHPDMGYDALDDRTVVGRKHGLEAAGSGQASARRWLARIRNWLERAEARVMAGFRVPPNGG